MNRPANRWRQQHRAVEAAANVLSGLGDHGRASELWAVADDLKADGRPGEPGEHRYLSTGCLHDRHDYCQSMTGYQGEKRPGKCKFCDAACVCPCHEEK